MKYLTIVKTLLRVVKSVLLPYLFTQAILLLGVFFLRANWIDKLLSIAALLVFTFTYYKIYVRFRNRVKPTVELVEKEKAEHKFITARGRNFYAVLAILSLITYLSAAWATWVIDYPGYAVNEEVAEYLSPEHKDTYADLLTVVPAYLSRPVIMYAAVASTTQDFLVISNKYKDNPDSFTAEDLQEVNDLQQRLDDLSSSIDAMEKKSNLYLWLPVALWLLHGIMLYPAMVKNEIRRCERMLASN